MKKKILIVDKSFKIGGIQSSMINMLNEIKDLYDIDLFMYYPEGPLKNRLSKDINIIKPSWGMKLVGMSRDDVKKSKNPFLIAVRYAIGAWCKYISNDIPLSVAFKTQKKLKGYDVAVAFHHELAKNITTSGFYRFIEERVEAKKKVGWIHYDAKTESFDDSINSKHFEKIDEIICVSKGTMESFLSKHPELRPKTDYCYNFHDISGITKKSEEKIEVPYKKEDINCFSACRLERKKGIDRVIPAVAEYLKAHTNVKWYIAGDGPDKKRIKGLIEEYGLKNSIFLLGGLSNPYPYMKKADLYLQPSRSEAAPMVFGEAHLLKVPVLSTETISAREMVEYENIGYVCENNGKAFGEALEMLIETEGMLDEYKKKILNEEFNNDNCIKKIKEIFGE